MPNNENKPKIMRSARPMAHPKPQSDGTQDEAAPTATQHTPQNAREEIELIKKENLTGRQLRIARRIAQKHGLQISSDLDAVRLLRKNGIDPFEAAPSVMQTPAQTGNVSTPANLPATVRRSEVSESLPPQAQFADVYQIQKDLVKRRRRRIAATLTKLFCFVVIPTILAGYYFSRVATPMYASYTEFVIQQAGNPSAGAGASSILSSSLLATAQDSISVQEYLGSREALARLNEDLGFKGAFQGDGVDVLQRLSDDATNEATYKVYKKRVRIGFDPTEGIIKMEVITPSPEQSYEFSKSLIGYAEQQVDQLTQRLREDQMKGAREQYAEAEEKYAEAQNRVVELQNERGILSGEGEIQSKMSLIQTLEADVQNRRLELIELLDNPRPNQTKLSVLERSIKSREQMIGDLRGELTTGTDASSSLAKILAELQAAETQVILRQEFLANSLAGLETSRVEANRQTRYLSMAVAPVLSDEASYPKTFENTLLAFVVFAGLYLMVSLTASILEEQLAS